MTTLIFQCSPFVKKTVKLQQGDPFKNTIVPSQTFEINTKQDNVVEGNNGTIIVCPKGCFKNAHGEIVTGNVKIELAEALTLDQMLLSNLTTTSNGKPLESGGMIYFNATSNGEQLTINKDNPVHIEIPTPKRKAGMMVYKGIRDKNRNMNWIEPRKLDNFLITVDINSLDFLPPGFRKAVAKGMPYKHYKIATPELTDSLYYSLSTWNRGDLVDSFAPTDYNEPYYSKNAKVVHRKYTADSYSLLQKIQTDSAEDIALNKKGIDPAIIKTIKSEKYQHTLIATREFEARLRVIFKTCNNAVLEIYTKNLDRNLYELDSMAAQAAGKGPDRQAFLNFAKQRLTKVRQADKYAKLLNGYYDKQLAKIRSQLSKDRKRMLKTLNRKNKEFQKVADDYKKLLWKREKYRMETYGFNWTSTGWINVDNGKLPKSWSKEPLEIGLENGKQYDKVYTYVVYTSIKSLYRLNTSNNKLFYAGNDKDKEMLMPKKRQAVVVAIGYKNGVPSMAIKTFVTGKQNKYSLKLTTSSIDSIKQALKPYEKYARENRISKDLEFMKKFYKEKQRQKELRKETEFLERLWNVAFPCIDLGG